jgi:hypothetical protein
VVAKASYYLPDLRQPVGHDPPTIPHPVGIGAVSLETDLEPVMARWKLVPQKLVGVIIDHVKIEIPILVIVSPRGAVVHPAARKRALAGIRPCKSTATQIPEKLVGRVVINEMEIEVSIQIEVSPRTGSAVFVVVQRIGGYIREHPSIIPEETVRAFTGYIEIHVDLPHTDETLIRAITEGVNPRGKQLDALMPRWTMSDEDLVEPLEHLKTLK